jgi:acyl-coenzyme A thioesterase PaaI-like protein
MQITKPQIKDKSDNLCFACGKDNPIGLKLHFTNEAGEIKGQFTPGELHQGWSGITHGGILYTLLDEAGGYAVMCAGLNCITAKSEVRFNSLAPVNETIQISARVTKKTSRLVETEATLSRQDGSTIAQNLSLWYIAGNSNTTKHPG